MEQILLVKRKFGIEWWSIDITRLTIPEIIKIIINEKGDDYQVKRTQETTRWDLLEACQKVKKIAFSLSETNEELSKDLSQTVLPAIKKAVLF